MWSSCGENDILIRFWASGKHLVLHLIAWLLLKPCYRMEKHPSILGLWFCCLFCLPLLFIMQGCWALLDAFSVSGELRGFCSATPLTKPEDPEVEIRGSLSQGGAVMGLCWDVFLLCRRLKNNACSLSAAPGGGGCRCLFCVPLQQLGCLF